jgi:poly-gamma-glutamate synthesis protein (capsule biosynthesis protein)
VTFEKLGKHIKRLGTLSLGLFLPWGVASQRARTERSDLTYPQRTRACTPGTHYTLAAVGDVLLHTNIANTGEAKGYPFLFEVMKPYLERTDFTYGNFEGSVNKARPLSSFPIFNYSPKLATALAAAGFDVMSTANNHALDTGPAGADGSIDALDAAKILHAGTVKQGKDIPDFITVPVKAADGTVLNVGFLSYTFGTNNIRDPNDQVAMVWNEDGKVREEVLESIAKARAATDLVIVAVHWGEEYHFLPNGQQQTGARAMVHAGADLVLGDHPHTLEPPAWIQAADHEGLVIYSLGNFVAAQQIFQAKSFTQTTMIFYVGLTKPATGRARVDTYRYLPVHIVNNTRPEPLTAAEDALSYQHVLDELRDPKGLAALPVDPPPTDGGPPLPNLNLCP